MFDTFGDVAASIDAVLCVVDIVSEIVINANITLLIETFVVEIYVATIIVALLLYWSSIVIIFILNV